MFQRMNMRERALTSILILLICLHIYFCIYIIKQEETIKQLKSRYGLLELRYKLMIKELESSEKSSDTNTSIPPIIRQFSDKILIVVDTGFGWNYTVKLDPIKEWRVKLIVFRGGSNPHPYNLAYPYAPIAFFFIEDMGEEDADNYSDLIIRMNPIIVDDKPMMCIVFFSEGSFIKYVYYDGKLIYQSPYSNYGIIYLPLEE